MTTWTTFGGSGLRDGWAAAGPDPGRAHVLWRAPFAGPVFASPVVSGGSVFVASERDSVEALSVASGKPLWQVHLGSPMPGSALPCGDIDPSGITSTPVVDASRGVLWVVAFVEPGRHELYGLDLRSGAVRSSVDVDPVGLDPLVEQQRGALALDGDEVVVEFGGLFGDCGDYRGALVAVSPQGSTSTFTVPVSLQGGLWAPGGPSVAPDGELLVTSGNGLPPGTVPGGDTVLGLTPGLSVSDWFAPPDSAVLDTTDKDFGSTGPILLPGNLVLQVGKAGTGYLLDRTHLRGGSVFSAQVCNDAYGADAATASQVLVPCSGGLVDLDIGAGPSFSVAWRDSGLVTGPPVVAGSVVWAQVPKAGTLVGLDGSSGATEVQFDVGAASRWSAPAVSGGDIFVAGGGNVTAVGD